MSGAILYILRCADGHFYVGTTRKALSQRVAEHNAGAFNGYTAARRPVKLVFSEHFPNTVDAIATERKIKGWSRAKKQALIDGDWSRVSLLARRGRPHPSRRRCAPPQDEGRG
ncbi:MAG: GIY-YIG nuclease family protein [Xanthobacteraceae bacterium]|uniref:GIY-YIG nuclease family protein n=1 Tax=Pseudolabrys sp. TaxID=1960880 RepID=UPI003D14DC1D